MAIVDNENKRLYQNNYETQLIFKSVQPEIDKLEAESNRIFNNTRITSIDLENHPEDLIIWEKTYGILPNLAVDTPEDRRDRILEYMRAQPPFTETWLNGDIDRGGEIRGELYRRTQSNAIRAEIDNLTLNIIYTIPSNMSFNVFFAQRVIRELMIFMRHIIPTNVIIFQTAETETDLGGIIQQYCGLSNIKITETVLEELIITYTTEISYNGLSNVKITETILRESIPSTFYGAVVRDTITGQIYHALGRDGNKIEKLVIKNI